MNRRFTPRLVAAALIHRIFPTKSAASISFALDMVKAGFVAVAPDLLSRHPFVT
jgi:hypothetical protein